MLRSSTVLGPAKASTRDGQPWWQSDGEPGSCVCTVVCPTAGRRTRERGGRAEPSVSAKPSFPLPSLLPPSFPTEPRSPRTCANFPTGSASPTGLLGKSNNLLLWKETQGGRPVRNSATISPDAKGCSCTAYDNSKIHQAAYCRHDVAHLASQNT